MTYSIYFINYVNQLAYQKRDIDSSSTVQTDNSSSSPSSDQTNIGSSSTVPTDNSTYSTIVTFHPAIMNP